MTDIKGSRRLRWLGGIAIPARRVLADAGGRAATAEAPQVRLRRSNRSRHGEVANRVTTEEVVVAFVESIVCKGGPMQLSLARPFSVPLLHAT